MEPSNGGIGTRKGHALFRRFCVLMFIAATASVSCARQSSDSIGGSLQITLQPAASSARPAYVAVTGVSSRDLSSLRSAHWSDADWQALLRVSVGDRTATEPAVIGKYAASDHAITFTPTFPLDPGRAYQVTFDPTRLPRPGQGMPVTSTVSLPAIATKPTTVVTAVYPDASVVPENLLRIYIQFSAPMGSSGAADFVHLVHRASSKEEVVEGAFLPVQADFWSPDHTRYTVFLDPGRVKLGILPNRQHGRPLRANHKYALVISPNWPDANRQPLNNGYRHEFSAGPAIKTAIDTSQWRIAAPVAGTRDQLVVTFPRPLNHAVVIRALGVESAEHHAINGVVSLEQHDTRWRFEPVEHWKPGEHSLIALAFLEDPQGNQIGRPFEAIEDELQNEPPPDGYRVPFTIAAR